MKVGITPIALKLAGIAVRFIVVLLGNICTAVRLKGDGGNLSAIEMTVLIQDEKPWLGFLT